MMTRGIKTGVAAAAVCAIMVFCAGPAVADSVYHSGHYNLTAVNAAPLRSGFVENIHANGPNVYAHEQYVLTGPRRNDIPSSPDDLPRRHDVFGHTDGRFRQRQFKRTPRATESRTTYSSPPTPTACAA